MKMGKMEKLIVNSTHHERRLVKWADEVLQYVPLKAGQSVLDVGCGTGALTRHLAQHHGLHATGADVDVEQIEEARQKAHHLTNIHFVVNDARDLHFADATFDTVITFKAMHHIEDWQNAIEEQVRVLKLGGYFIIFDIVSPSWLSRIKIAEFGVIMESALTETLADNSLRVMNEGRNGFFKYVICHKL